MTKLDRLRLPLGRGAVDDAVELLDGEEHRLEPGVWARVGIGQLRRLVPGPEGIRLIVIGGTPGQAFVPPAWTELGAVPPQMPE